MIIYVFINVSKSDEPIKRKKAKHVDVTPHISIVNRNGSAFKGEKKDAVK